MRTKHPTSVEATVRALRIGWALHEGTTTLLRTLRSATAPPALTVVSTWLLSGLGLDTLYYFVGLDHRVGHLVSMTAPEKQ